MFCISFVVVTVKARIAGLDPRLEQAAMDLYADEKTTFRKVTFPLVLPGIVAAALLAFSLSFDDFVITNFTSGQTVTFPMYVWGAAGRGIPPEANVVGAIMFGIALIVVLVPEVWSSGSASAERTSGEGPGSRSLTSRCVLHTRGEVRCSVRSPVEGPRQSGEHPRVAEGRASRRPSGSMTPRRPSRGRSWPSTCACDLLVVGGGFTGLWTALLAKEEDPSLDVVLARG